MHFQVTTTVTRKWYRKGSEPQVGSAPGRKNVSYSGYVIPSTGELIVTKPDWFNYETVIESFRKFIREYGCNDNRRIVMVIDNAPWHKKALRLIQTDEKEEYADIRKRMDIVCLPAYSPDLNPIEQVWRKTRREVTHNRYFSNKAELENKLDLYFKEYRTRNNELASLCSFKHRY